MIHVIIVMLTAIFSMAYPIYRVYNHYTYHDSILMSVPLICMFFAGVSGLQLACLMYKYEKLRDLND